MTTLLYAVDGFLFGLLIYVFIVYLAFFRMILPAMGGELDASGEVRPGLDERILRACGPRQGPWIALVAFVVYPMLCLLTGAALLGLTYGALDLDAWLGLRTPASCAALTSSRLSQCMDNRMLLGAMPALALCAWIHMKLYERKRACELAAWETQWARPALPPATPPKRSTKPAKRKATRQ